MLENHLLCKLNSKLKNVTIADWKVLFLLFAHFGEGKLKFSSLQDIAVWVKGLFLQSILKERVLLALTHFISEVCS